MNIIKNGNKLLGTVLGFKQKYKSLKVTNTALDGTPYIQTTGKATERRDTSVFCDTPEKRINLDSASNTAALLDVTWRDVQYRGYIEGDITWNEWKDETGVGKFTLVVKEVVT